MNGSHSPMPFEVTQPSLEVNHSLSMKAEKTYVLYFGEIYVNIPLIMAIQHPEPYLSTRLWAFSWIVMYAVLSEAPSPPAPAAPWTHPIPIPQAAESWINSWIIYLETGRMHRVHLIQLSVFLPHKQSKPITLHMGKEPHWGRQMGEAAVLLGFLHWVFWVGSNEQGEPTDYAFKSNSTYGYRCRSHPLCCELSSPSCLPCFSIS